MERGNDKRPVSIYNKIIVSYRQLGFAKVFRRLGSSSNIYAQKGSGDLKLKVKAVGLPHRKIDHLL